MPTLKSVESDRTLNITTYGGPHTMLLLRGGCSGASAIKLDGAALRDALLEAFPLPVEKTEPELIDVVPGMVLGAIDLPYRYTILPGDRYYDNTGCASQVYDDEDPWTDDTYAVVFDPRDAEALPSPFGIRVGDTVTRTQTKDGVTRTVTFTVDFIDAIGTISTKYGPGYFPDGFDVVGGGLDRLPAGTITRKKGDGVLFLTTEDSWIDLSDGFQASPGGNLAGGVRDGRHEVIYLP